MNSQKLNESYEHASPSQSPGFRFWQAFIVWQKQIDKELLQHNLNQLSFSILAISGWISLEQDEVRQKVIVDMSGMDKMQVSLILQRLVKNGFVKIKPYEQDKRERIVKLTSSGKMALQKSIPIVEKIDLEHVPKCWIDQSNEK